MIWWSNLPLPSSHSACLLSEFQPYLTQYRDHDHSIGCPCSMWPCSAPDLPSRLSGSSASIRTVSRKCFPWHQQHIIAPLPLSLIIRLWALGAGTVYSPCISSPVPWLCSTHGEWVLLGVGGGACSWWEHPQQRPWDEHCLFRSHQGKHPRWSWTFFLGGR